MNLSISKQAIEQLHWLPEFIYEHFNIFGSQISKDKTKTEFFCTLKDSEDDIESTQYYLQFIDQDKTVSIKIMKTIKQVTIAKTI